MHAITLKTSIPGPKSQALLVRRKAALPQGPLHIAPIFVGRGGYEAARFALGI
jgi:hypothetical protein